MPNILIFVYFYKWTFFFFFACYSKQISVLEMMVPEPWLLLPLSVRMSHSAYE